MQYTLIEWPESQNYMDQPWFRKECFLAVSTSEDYDDHIDSAYFIPTHRINELEAERSVEMYNSSL